VNTEQILIFKTIDSIVHKRITELEYTKTEEAIIQEIINPDDGSYWIKYNSGVLKAYAANPLDVYKTDDKVQI